ncbi:hypothetical protein BDN72DRAFT_67019 [Pluteus cervinus]|uniref:Uncharacterized protein n=1 Tax=Pluteus cervinus TaxID=181527 RepID=A0ACD3AQI4_9AGAR|nr:hypothetical protein BDN72DRAFT_67019 [Pluteus cervinus]
MSFPNHHLLHILLGYVYISQDYHTLAQCALVNREFNEEASQFLYAKVVHSPPLTRGLNLNRRGGILPSVFVSASLPKYARCVKVLEISGHLSPRPPPQNAFPSILSSALPSFVNLKRVVFNPVLSHEDLFVESLRLLAAPESESKLEPKPDEVVKRVEKKNGLEALTEEDEEEGETANINPDIPPDALPIETADIHLQSLVVGTASVHEKCAPILGRIRGLEELTIYNPSRALLNILPEWLDELNDLTGLYLKNNCGSITPGVLQSLLPHIQAKLKAFTLGLSYSLTNENVWNFLSKLESLEWLQLRYYLQFRSPRIPPVVPTLNTFTVEYLPIQTRSESDKLCKWVRRTTGSGPPLQHLRLLCLQDDDTGLESEEGNGLTPCWQDGNWTQPNGGSNPSFDSLIWHLVGSYWLGLNSGVGAGESGFVRGRMLKTLDMRASFIGYRALEGLLQACLELEEVFLCVGRDALRIFVEHGSGLTRLHTALFNIRNVKQSKTKLTVESVTEIMQKSPPVLKRLGVNGIKWERTYVTRTPPDGGMVEVTEIVTEVTSKPPPWRRTVL